MKQCIKYYIGFFLVIVIPMCMIIARKYFMGVKRIEFLGTPTKIRSVKNPLNSNKSFIKWQLPWDTFLKRNWPNTFDFDFDIKKDIVLQAINLPKDFCIIDCGAHIGDGSIPIADALKQKDRGDITVFALDPSAEKCAYIKEIARINSLDNIEVLQIGLSDKIGKYNHKIGNYKKWSNNSGATEWVDASKNEANLDTASILFTMLDNLVQLDIINKPIGYIHLDVKGMELNVLKGAINTIKKYKPILSIEEHDVNNNTIKEFLESIGYTFTKRLQSNNIYAPNPN